MFSGKNGAARLSILIVLCLIILKIIFGIITGSLSVLAQAVDSFLDLFAVSITFMAIRVASRPALFLGEGSRSGKRGARA